MKTMRQESRGRTARFRLKFEIHYSVSGLRVPMETGFGRTIDMSSSGLRFNADRPLQIGQKLDVSIDWPVMLDGGVQLQLIVSGVVVRSSGNETALRIQRHEFKTRRMRPNATLRQESVASVPGILGI
jgi:hypothetical protein